MTMFTTRAAEPIVASDRVSPAAGRAHALVRELTAVDRERLLAHFLALDEDDRLLRFGQVVPDHVIENYVRAIDFTRDTVFGVFDRALQLIGVGHLAYLPVEGDKRTAEFGVSVLESSRGEGIGSKLFERAAMRSRNTHVTTLYIHCHAGARGSVQHHCRNASGTSRGVRLRAEASGLQCIEDFRIVYACCRGSVSIARRSQTNRKGGLAALFAFELATPLI
jgi:GNAT superfamily N-acetyltransferase